MFGNFFLLDPRQSQSCSSVNSRRERGHRNGFPSDLGAPSLTPLSPARVDSFAKPKARPHVPPHLQLPEAQLLLTRSLSVLLEWSNGKKKKN